MTLPITGGCLCGAVRYEVNAAPIVMGDCHCVDCRRTSGTGHASNIMVPEAAFSVTGKVSAYDRPADSGNIVTRCFCPVCGSGVYGKNSGMPELVYIRASGLDDPETYRAQAVVYTRSAAKWSHIDPALPAFEAMPPPEAMQKLLGGA
jgi:hypothetical protein